MVRSVHSSGNSESHAGEIYSWNQFDAAPEAMLASLQVSQWKPSLSFSPHPADIRAIPQGLKTAVMRSKGR